MNDFSKLMLSDEEQQLVNNSGWILTKRKIIDKANGILGVLSEDLKLVINNERDWLPPAVVQSTPKISKGENYLQLPYLILDYPRCFDTKDIFAIRTMFWWGNFFSMTLLLTGTFKEMFQEKIFENLCKSERDIFICINESQWHAHFDTDNFVPVKLFSDYELKEIILHKQFVKLAIKFPLHQWNDILTLLNKTFKEIIDMLKDQLPRR